MDTFLNLGQYFTNFKKINYLHIFVVVADVDENFMPWLMKEVASEMETMCTSRDVLTGNEFLKSYSIKSIISEFLHTHGCGYPLLFNSEKYLTNLTCEGGDFCKILETNIYFFSLHLTINARALKIRKQKFRY